MAVVGAVLSPVYGRDDLAESGIGLANTLFMVCLAVFIAVIGIGLVTAEDSAGDAGDSRDKDDRGAPEI